METKRCVSCIQLLYFSKVHLRLRVNGLVDKSVNIPFPVDFSSSVDKLDVKVLWEIDETFGVNLLTFGKSKWVIWKKNKRRSFCKTNNLSYLSTSPVLVGRFKMRFVALVSFKLTLGVCLLFFGRFTIKSKRVSNSVFWTELLSNLCIIFGAGLAAICK